MRTLYFDCFAGASGDMILGALIDAGIDPVALNTELLKLGMPDFELTVERVDRSGLSSTHIRVSVTDEKKHRHFRDIEEIISRSSLSDGVKLRSLAIFRRLAEAEAKVHGTEAKNVHFHEVGAMDAIIDIVGACIGFELLGVEQFACSRINVGSGFVRMDHGTFPVPPPAVAQLLIGIPIYSNEIEGEFITPTGAAIISSVCAFYGQIPEMRTARIGYGAGTRTYPGFPNALRILIGNAEIFDTAARTDAEIERMVLLETNIDDCTPQLIGYILERAISLGANDSWVTPIQMKKGRPAFAVSILCRMDSKQMLLEFLYAETTTLGVRVSAIERDALARRIVQAKTHFGTIDVKISELNGQVVNIMPEFEQVKRAAIDNNIPFTMVHQAAIDALENRSAAVGK